MMIHIDTHASGVRDAMVLFQNVLADGTLAWSSQTADGYAANALGPQTYDFWTPSSLPATLSVTLAAPAACDACAIVAHTLGSAGATVHVEHYIGAAWVISQSVTPLDNSDMLLIFASAESAQWRIRITGSTVPHIGVAMIGQRFIIPNGVQAGYVPINLALDVDLSPSITIKGQYVGAFVKRVGASTGIGLAMQEVEWIETEAKPFIAHYNAGQPFIWASCPELLPDDAGYCWRSGGTLRASYGPGVIWGQMSMDVQAYVGS